MKLGYEPWANGKVKCAAVAGDTATVSYTNGKVIQRSRAEMEEWWKDIANVGYQLSPSDGDIEDAVDTPFDWDLLNYTILGDDGELTFDTEYVPKADRV